MKEGLALHLHKLESPPPKDVLRQIWLKTTKWFWRKRYTDGRLTKSDQKSFLELSAQVI